MLHPGKTHSSHCGPPVKTFPSPALKLTQMRSFKTKKCEAQVRLENINRSAANEENNKKSAVPATSGGSE